MRLSLAIAWFAVLAVGCSSAPPRAGSAGETGAGTGGGSQTYASPPDDGDHAEDHAERPASCPAHYGDPGPSCAGQAPPQLCSYPEGDCYCGDEPRCSGVKPEPTPPRWVCVPHRAPCPAAGTACDGSTPVCAPWCCGMGVACQGGIWQAQMFPCPP